MDENSLLEGRLCDYSWFYGGYLGKDFGVSFKFSI